MKLHIEPNWRLDTQTLEFDYVGEENWTIRKFERLMKIWLYDNWHHLPAEVKEPYPFTHITDEILEINEGFSVTDAVINKLDYGSLIVDGETVRQTAQELS